MKFILVLILVLICSPLIFSQSILATHRKQNQEVFIKVKKIQSVVTKDGLYYEGRPKLMANGLLFKETVVSFDEIGILEIKRISAKQVASFPLKLVGIVTGGAGLIMTSAYVADDQNTDAAVGVAGLALVGIGTGALLLGRKTGTQSSNDTVRSFHVGEWEFSYTGN